MRWPSCSPTSSSGVSGEVSTTSAHGGAVRRRDWLMWVPSSGTSASSGSVCRAALTAETRMSAPTRHQAVVERRVQQQDAGARGQARRDEAVQDDQVVRLVLVLRRVVARAHARDLGARTQAQRALDEDVAFADQQHARRPVAAEHGPRGVVQRQVVRLIEAGFEGVRRARQIVPLLVRGRVRGDAERAGVEAIAIHLQTQRGAGRLRAVVDHARESAQASVGGARRRALRPKVVRGWRAHAQVADRDVEIRRHLRTVEAAVADDDDLRVGVALGQRAGHRQRSRQVRRQCRGLRGAQLDAAAARWSLEGWAMTCG